MSVTDETKAVAPEAATAPAEAEPTKEVEKAADAAVDEKEEETKPEEKAPKADEAPPSAEAEAEEEELMEEEEEMMEEEEEEEESTNDGGCFKTVEKEDEDDDDEEDEEESVADEEEEDEEESVADEEEEEEKEVLTYEEQVARRRARNQQIMREKGWTGGLIPYKPKAKKPTKRKSKMPSEPTRSQPSRRAKSDVKDYYGPEDEEEEKKPKARSGKRKSSEKELDCEPEKKKRRKSGFYKDEMKTKVKEMEDMGVEAWCNQNQLPPPTVIPNYLKDLKIDGKSISEFTVEDVRAIDVDKLNVYNRNQLRALLCVCGGKNRGNMTELKNRVKHFMETGEMEKGFRNEDKSQFFRQSKSNFKNDHEINVLGSLFTLPLLDEYAEVVKIQRGKIVIAATPEGTTPSNLQCVANMMDKAYGINKSISQMMNRVVSQCNFLIGPSTHGYYNDKKVQSKDYENEELELIHPDITPDYQPGDNDGTMRKF